MKHLPLTCPIDGLSLSCEETVLKCPSNHSFDISRQGYANLLPVQFKSSKDPGDSKIMVNARRRVLQTGIFNGLADALVVAVKDELVKPEATEQLPLIVDAGCGEGFYLDYLNCELNKVWKTCHLLGVDISKWAIAAAAKKYKKPDWAVANNKRLPIENGSASIIISAFGFETWQPWSELQSAGQCVITVDSGTRHLMGLRELIYDKVHLHEAPEPEDAITAGYQLSATQSVQYQYLLSGATLLADLVSMTPHAHRADSTKIQQLNSLEELVITVDTVMRIYHRTK